MVIEQFPDGDAFADGLGLREPFLLFLGYGPLDFGERKSRLFRCAFVMKRCTPYFPRHYPLWNITQELVHQPVKQPDKGSPNSGLCQHTDESVHGGMEPPYNPPLVTE